MVDDGASLHGGAERALLQEVGFEEEEFCLRVAAPQVPQGLELGVVLQAPDGGVDGVAPREQLGDELQGDEARAASDEHGARVWDVHCLVSFLVPVEVQMCTWVDIQVARADAVSRRYIMSGG